MKESFFPMGYVAEDLVERYLSNRGHKVLTQNYSGRGFECDLVTRVKNTLVLVEVKFRDRNIEHIELESLLSPKKKRCLLKGINSFISLRTQKYDTIRCDLALACYEQKHHSARKKPYNLSTGIRLYYYEDISLEA